MTRGPELVEIAPDVEPEHVARAVTRTAGGRGDGAAEAQLCQVEAGDECIDHAHERVRGDIIVKARRKQADLAAFCSFDEAHEHLRASLNEV